MLLGARQFFERRGKSAPTARDYVQTGLVAMWDGIENAGWGVHDTAAISWKDLIGSRDLDLYTAAFSADALYRATNATGYLAYASQSPTAWVVKTVEFCCDLHYKDIIIPYSVATWDGIGYWSSRISGKSAVTSGATFQTVCGGINRKYPKPFIGGDVNGTISCEWDRVSGAWASSCYFNAAAMSEDSSLPDAGGNPTTSSIALGSNGAYDVYGSIHSVRCYSRALTAAEVAHNYAVDKERFGLT